MSKIDVLLILAPSWCVDFPPLGISYLSSSLRTNGYTVKVLDLNIILYHLMPAREKKWWSMSKLNCWTNEKLFPSILSLCDSYLDAIVNEILLINARIIGFSVYDSNRLFSLEMAKRIKRKNSDTFIVFGGPGCCNEEKRSRMLFDTVDMIVIGEGEKALLNIVSKNSSVDRKGLQGIISFPPIMNIDCIPFPTFSEFNLKLYLEQNTLPILMSRGCIGRCSFCNDRNLSKPFRCRSPANLLSEIKELTNRYKVTNFGFQDLAINGNLGLLDNFCQLLILEGVDIFWTVQAILSDKMSEDLLRRMHAAGCTVLIYGLESASNKILRKMGKSFTKDIAQEVIRNTHKAGIGTFINIIVGFPGESEDNFQETADFIKNNRKYIDMVSSLNTCCINSDTELELYPDDYGVLLPDDPRIRPIYWKEKDGTDYAIRCRRARELLLLLKDLNIPVNQNNLYAETVI